MVTRQALKNTIGAEEGWNVTPCTDTF